MQNNAEALIQSCTSSLMMTIRQYTDDQLQSLLSDETRLDNMIDNLPQIASLPSEKEVKLAQSKSMAECNLSMEPQVKEKKAKLAKTYEEAVKTKAEVEALKAQLDNVAENRSLDVISALLQASAREAEDESEKIAEQFYSDNVAENRSLDVISALLQASAREAEDESEKIAEQFYSGGMDIGEFVKAFEEKRMLAHKRKVKSEKLDEILKSQEYPSPNPGSSGVPPVPSRTPYPVGNVGYPSVPSHIGYPRFT
uniref:VPS37 C-terminal domain-containing protein n=1 Tax=Panagrolaimus sp. ES5 TaxID=591445 RepID=A0AC34G0T6_9BILA